MQTQVLWHKDEPFQQSPWTRWVKLAEETVRSCKAYQCTTAEKTCTPLHKNLLLEASWQSTAADFARPSPDNEHLLYKIFKVPLALEVMSLNTAAVTSKLFDMFMIHRTPGWLKTDNIRHILDESLRSVSSSHDPVVIGSQRRGWKICHECKERRQRIADRKSKNAFYIIMQCPTQPLDECLNNSSADEKSAPCSQKPQDGMQWRWVASGRRE